jgi:hypothetical protein
METSVMEEIPKVAMAFRNFLHLPAAVAHVPPASPFARLLVNRSLRSLQRRLLGKSQHESQHDTLW